MLVRVPRWQLNSKPLVQEESMPERDTGVPTWLAELRGTWEHELAGNETEAPDHWFEQLQDDIKREHEQGAAVLQETESASSPRPYVLQA